MNAYKPRKKPGGSKTDNQGGIEAGRSALQKKPATRLSSFYSAGPAVPLAAPVQAKLSIGEPGDRFEREADAVAERVTTGRKAPPISSLPTGGLGAGAQRQPDEQQEETAQQKPVQRQPDEQQEETAQQKPVQRQPDEQQEETAQQKQEETATQRRETGAAAPAPGAQQIARQTVQQPGPGEPLRSDTRRHLESGMGVDLGEVRVHDDQRARESASALKARAFTHKNHIWLGRGESQSDLGLMAHEATHTLQQGGITRRKPAEPRQDTGADGGATDRDGGPSKPKGTDTVPGTAIPAAAGGPRSQRPKPSVASATAQAPALSREIPGAAAAAPVPVESTLGAVEAEQTEVDAQENEPSADVAAEGEPPPAGQGAVAPSGDARFHGVIKRLNDTAHREKTHEPAGKKVDAARAAAESPANDRSSRAQAKQVDTMAAQQPKKPEKNDFLSMLRAELQRIAPNNMEETEQFKQQGKAGALKTSLTGKVDAQKADSAKDIKAAAETQPDPESVTAREPTPLPEEPVDQPPLDLRANNVLPIPKPDKDISARANKDKADQLMKDNDIDEQQLKRANEPQFTDALAEKRRLEEHADKVPEVYREEEQSYLTEAEADVLGKEVAAKDEMRTRRSKAKNEVGAKQSEAKKREEQERKKVADDIQGMYQTTKKKVADKLNALDGEVNRLFDSAEKQARDSFESYVDRKMADYKWNRYIRRIGGSVLWAKDKLFGMPDEVNRFYEEGRDRYIQDMDGVLVKIADTVETRLKEAKEEITRGKEKIREYVEGLPKILQQAGTEAEAKVASQFHELEQGVDDKRRQLAQQMAKRYQEARTKLDERIEELKAQNQGLLDGFIAKLKAIIEMLRKFKEQIMGLMESGADTVRSIVKDPVGFLKKLLAAVKKGFSQFKDNIVLHLKRGLVSWLFGTMAKAGIQIPSEFNLKAIFGLVLQVLGITKERIREKLVKLIGAKNVARIEQAWGVVATLISEGPAGLWKRIKTFIGNLKEMVLGAVREWLITQIIKQAVLWVISLFNPAAALLKAIKLIYDVIMFFVENIQRILELVKSVLQSAAQIVAGNIAAAASWIEAAMGRTVPIIIGFLARVLGLSGISDKIKSVILKIQKRVDAAIDKVLLPIAKGIKKIYGKGKTATQRAAQAVQGFVFPKQTFKAGEESHTIFFEGKGTAAQAMVASRRPRTLTALLNTLAAKPQNTNKQSDVRSARGHLRSLTRFQNALKGAQDQKSQDRIRGKIRSKIKDVAVPLANLLEGETFGTRKSPLPLDWPKPASSAYPVLYLGPKSAKRIPQVTLKGAAAGNQSKIAAVEKKLTPDDRKAWAKDNYKVNQYTPHGSQTLPGGEASIGVEPPWTLSAGKEFRLKLPQSTTGGGLINSVLRPYGFRPAAEDKDADHIVEMQLGGSNTLKNLWPLKSQVNRDSGRMLSRKVFDVKGTKIPMSVVKARVTKGSRPVWVKITGTK